MPRSTKLSAVISLGLLVAGCASQPARDGGNAQAFYRESAMDIANRAPDSMSIPAESGPVEINNLHLRHQADFHYTLAEAYSLEGNTTRAVEEYKLTLVYDPKAPSVRLRLAAEYVKQGLISEAMDQTKAALEVNPNYEDAHLLLGGLYSALRMYDDALNEYALVIKQNPDNFEAPMFVGALLAEQKKYAEASAYFEKLGKNSANPNAHLAWYYMGRVRLEESREKNLGKAEMAFQQSLVVKPSYGEAALALAQLYLSSARKEKAVQLMRTFQEKYGPHAGIAEELAKVFIEQKDYTQALEQLTVMESADPDDLSPKVKIAFILIEQEKFQEAIVKLEDVLARAPGSDKIRFYLGAVYEEVKDYKSAISHFQKVPVGSSYYPESVIHSAYLYKLLNDYDKAIETIQAGIKSRDDHPPFYALYASFLDDTKQYKKGVEMLKQAAVKFPDHAQLQYFLGNMEDRLGNKEATISAMQKVLEIDGNHVQALNYLAFTYAELGQNLEMAEKLVRQATELQPNDGYILDTLGWVLFKRGKTGEAIRILEAAYKIQPDESIIAEHLGDAYYHHQMPEKAKKLYMRAAETEKNVTAIEKIRAKIVSIDNQKQSLKLEEVRKPASAMAP